MKTILITGSTRGIGRAAAQGLLARGARVIITGRDPNRLQDTCTALGSSARGLHLDLCDPASIAAAADAVSGEFGSIDVLVNNAAILLDHYSPLGELSDEVLRATLEANVIGTLRVTRAFLPLLKKSPSPRIINVSSGAGQFSGGLQAFAPAYSISKAALNMLTCQIAAAEPGIAVNSMCPGWCRTDMGGAEAPRTPEEGADTIEWLSLDAPQSLRGQFFRDRQQIDW
ncbi:MAG: SDR family oxidoreductase [Terrimicrobiaceae bacterium]